MALRRLLTVIACTTSAVASASPRSDPTTGRAVWTGATEPSATSIVLNPAAVGTGVTDELYVSLGDVIDQLSISRRLLALDGSTSAGPTVHDVEVSPAATFGFVWHAGDVVTFGFEASTPPAEMFPANEDALRYHILGGRQRDLMTTVSLTFKVASELYVGASLTHDNTFLRLHYARDTALEAGHGPGGVDSDCGGAACGLENPLATETYDVKVRSGILSSNNLAVNVGVAIQFVKNTWLGIAYHTPPGTSIQTELTGSMLVTRAPRDVAATGGQAVIPGEATVDVSLPASVDTEFRTRLPRRFDLHIGGRWEDLSRMRAYDVRGYGQTLAAYNVPEWTIRPRGLHDSFSLWGGVEQIDSGERVRWGARLGAETSSVDARDTSPLTVAPFSLTADAGVQLRPTRGSNWVFQLTYGLQYFPKVSVTDSRFDPRARIECIENGHDYSTSACEAVRDGYAIDTALGDYGHLQHAVRIALRYVLP